MRCRRGSVGAAGVALVLAVVAHGQQVTPAGEGTVTCLPSQFSLAPRELVTLVPEPQAAQKQVARQDARATWGVQCPIDGRTLKPGRIYRLHAVARVRPAAPDVKGPAFGVGVYDYVRRAAVLWSSLWPVERFPPDTWQTLDCGAWIPAPHEQAIYVGTATGAMAYLEIERFTLVPKADATLDALAQRLARERSLALVARGGQYGLAAVEMADARGLALEMRASGRWDPNLFPNAWAGLVVSYHTAKGYTRRASLAFGTGWRGKPAIAKAPAGLSTGEAIEATLPGTGPRDAWLPLASILDAHAPAGWDGRAWIGVLVQGLSVDQAGLVALLVGKPWGELGVLDSFHDDAPDYGMDYAGILGASPVELAREAARQRRAFLERRVRRPAGGRLPAYLLRTVSPQAHVFDDRVDARWLESAAPLQPVSLSMARREYESAQVALVPTGGRALSAVRVSMGALIGPGGARIPAGDVRLWRVESVYVPKPALGQSPGRWPDPLMENAPFDVPAGENRAVWLTVRTRQETRPGIYRGSLLVRPGNASPAEVPVTITVWDFALPLRNHLRTDFWLSWGQAERFYGCPKGLPQALQYRILDFLNAYRIGADFAAADHMDVENRGFRMFREADGSYTFDFSELERLLERCFAGGQNTLNMALACWASQPWDHMRITDRATGREEIYKVKGYDDPTFWPIYGAFLKAFSRRLKERGWWRYAIYQGWDEPQEARGDFEGLKKVYAFVKQQVPDVPRLITTAPNRKLDGAIDVWCPLDVFFDPAACKDRRERGEQTWWYVIGNRFNHSLPPMDARMVFWTTWKYDLAGLLYWSSDWWCGPGDDGRPCNVSADPAKRWPNVPWQFGAETSGQLFYPGPKGPLPSQRLEAIRDGIEDYEYLHLLRDRLHALRGAGRAPAWAAEAGALLAVPAEVAADKYASLQDPERLQAIRRRLAQMILSAGALAERGRTRRKP